MFLKQGKIEQKFINVFFLFIFQASLFRAILFLNKAFQKLLFILQTLKCFETSFFFCVLNVFSCFEILKNNLLEKNGKKHLQFASQVWCGLHVSS